MNSILNYEVVFRAEPEGGLTVNVPALEGCVTYGEILQEAKAIMAKEAINLYLESLIAYGEEVLIASV